MESIRLRNLWIQNPDARAIRGDLDFAADFGAGGTPLLDLDLDGYVAFPGLVNSHDHIPGNWYRRIGEPPYRNTYHWLETYRNLPEHTEKANVWVLGVKTPTYERNQDALKRLGIFKNAISGVTTVLDHLPRQAPDYYQGNGIRIVENYRQIHSPRLGNMWGGLSVEEELALAGTDLPFIVHLAEGTDDEARAELDRFDILGGVRKNLVIVHGVGLTERNLDLIARTGASVVWCPASNVYLLDAVMNLPRARAAGVRIALGTDTTMTGSANLLEEMRLGEAYSKRFFGESIPRPELFRQATAAGAELMGLERRIGAIRHGYSADFFLLKDDGGDPLDRLFSATPRDIALSVCEGKPVYGDPRFAELFRERGVDGRPFEIAGTEKLLFRDPLEPLATVNGVMGTNHVWPALFLGNRHYAEIEPTVRTAAHPV